MKVKKIPLRSCAVTKEKLPKWELLRIVRNKDGHVMVDVSGKQNGRGVYLKKDKSVLEKARKTKVLERHLECGIPDEVYLEIEQVMNQERGEEK